MMHVSDLMTKDPVTLALSDEFDVVNQLMKYDGIRHLPVVDKGKLVGLLSHRDVLRVQAKLLMKRPTIEEGDFTAHVPVSEVMTKDVDTVRPDSTIRDAAKLMLRKRYGCLPVTGEDGRLIGILTDTDILRWAIERDES